MRPETCFDLQGFESLREKSSGNMMRGNRTESLREERLPPEKVSESERTSENLREVPSVTSYSLPMYLSEGFRRPLGDPPRRRTFLWESETLSLVAPHRVAP